MSSLISGLTVLSSVGVDLHKRLLKSVGLTKSLLKSSDAPSIRPYEIFRPNPRWSRLESSDLKILGVPGFRNIAEHIVHFEIPSDILQTFHAHNSVQFPSSKEESMRMDEIFNAETLPLINTFVGNAVAFFPDDYKAVIAKSRLGEESTVYDKRYASYMGLHVDNWCEPKIDLMRRNKSAVRIFVNLGTEARDLNFINLTLAQILEIMQSHEKIEAFRSANNPIQLCHAFMENFPEYPVVQLEVYPGEGCVVPVCNIIHDGYTLYKSEPDVNLTLTSQGFCLRESFLASFISKDTLSSCCL
ncbi:hypothetical protein [Oligoflexus tunisiensis]|uniref:hypothetical protein n=1 Tax=Oligoflexus tunisiensis TaxID=708132 RepID=UPI00114CEA34|nr:hypothetical protein [Oligoflexus tunisiensis]